MRGSGDDPDRFGMGEIFVILNDRGAWIIEMQMQGRQDYRPGRANLPRVVTSFVIGAVSFVGSIITIASAFGETYLRQLLVISMLSAAVALLVSYATYAIFAHYQKKMLRRRERALYSVLKSNSAFSQWLAGGADLEWLPASTIYGSISLLLDAYRRIMEVRTKSKIRVAIKAVGMDGNGIRVVRVVARDSASSFSMRSIDEWQQKTSPLCQSDLSSILGGSDYFIGDGDTLRSMQPKNTTSRWRPPWKSVLSVPIRPDKPTGQLNQLIGVLTIDSSRRRAFAGEEIELAQLLSDQLIGHLLIMGRSALRVHA
jgi:hypothetical protein